MKKTKAAPRIDNSAIQLKKLVAGTSARRAVATTAAAPVFAGGYRLHFPFVAALLAGVLVLF